MRKIKKLCISEKSLISLLENLFDLPSDTEIIDVSNSNHRGFIQIIIHSDEFRELQEGSEPAVQSFKLNTLI